jgi:hypothetical protein
MRNGSPLCLLVVALGGAMVFNGTGTQASDLSKQIAAARARLVAGKNQRALEAYEKRNAEVTPWVEGAVPVNTYNAALLYYQASLFVPEPNADIRYKIRPNATPTTEIRTYLGRCLPVIEMLETASRIPGCTWGVWSEGGLSQMPWTRKIGFMKDILLLDATTLAFDGHYRVALEQCLTVRRIARHISDDPVLSSYGLAFDGRALYTIRILLGMMPPDANILTWLRGQFAVVPGPRLSYAKSLWKVVKIQLDAMKTYPERIDGFKNIAAMKVEGEQAKENIRNLTDEQFISRAREGLAAFADSIFRILDSEATCNQKLAQIDSFIDETMGDDATDPILEGIISGLNLKGQIDLGYMRGFAHHKARVNATKAAVEIYLVLAKTGKLPDKLPDYLPKDPFIGRDFLYEITDEGFTLRCEGNKFLASKGITLEFRVREKD